MWKTKYSISCKISGHHSSHITAHVIIIDKYMAFSIFPLLSARDLDICPEGFSPRDDISRGLITRTIWKRPCINLFITYFSRADNMLLPFTKWQIPCYCPLKMLLPRRQITRRKLRFYYICKFGVISIKYVIIMPYYTPAWYGIIITWAIWYWLTLTICIAYAKKSNNLTKT